MEFLIWSVTAFFAYAPWVIYMLCVPRMVHIFQMESYKAKDYMRWLSKNSKKAFSMGASQLIACAIYGIAILIINLLLSKYAPIYFSPILLLVEYIMFFLVFMVTNISQIKKDIENRKTAKKKLVYTARAKRLIFFNFIVFILLIAAFIFGSDMYVNTDLIADVVLRLRALISNEIFALTMYSIFIFLLPVNILLGNYFAWPTEQAYNNKYIRSAKRILRKKQHKDLIKIGITGSYGKTSTKFILKTILSEKYNVLATPESYNTTMGNVRVIREQLKPEHEVFISEMGARYKRDIWEICDIVNPKYGIITSIGPQHLETFKNIDNIVSTKAELIHSVSNDGAVFLPRDNEHCKKLFNKEEKEKY